MTKSNGKRFLTNHHTNARGEGAFKNMATAELNVCCFDPLHNSIAHLSSGTKRGVDTQSRTVRVRHRNPSIQEFQKHRMHLLNRLSTLLSPGICCIFLFPYHLAADRNDLKQQVRAYFLKSRKLRIHDLSRQGSSRPMTQSSKREKVFHSSEYLISRSVSYPSLEATVLCDRIHRVYM